MKKIFRSYYVWPRFPSVSMSGNMCNLSCKHCNHKYLNDMQDITTPEKLIKKSREFVEDKCVGFLLSGGCNKNGEMLNLKKLLPAIKKIKDETSLIIKLHAGFVNKALAEDIASAGVDIASVEVVGSNESIREIFNFKASVKSYQSTLSNLESAGISYIVPHICIGLHYGMLKGEFNALNIIKDACKPSSLVIIIFRPTRGTIMEKCKIPNVTDISSVINEAKKIFKDKDVSLGCIRPRSKCREKIEVVALESGVTRMEIPSRHTIENAKKMGYEIKKINACCALPVELEHIAIEK